MRVEICIAKEKI
ncbi:hypothetical protein ECEC4448_3083, partial [Escherichia coli EC4448]